jgi:hypothetical protein
MVLILSQIKPSLHFLFRCRVAVQTSYSADAVQFRRRTVQTSYSSDAVQFRRRTVQTPYSADAVQFRRRTVPTSYNADGVKVSRNVRLVRGVQSQDWTIQDKQD